MTVREFWVIFGLKPDTRSIREVSTMIYDLIDSTAQLGVQVLNLATRFGLTTDALQEYRYAAGQALIDTAAFDDGMRYLQKNAYDATQGNIEAAKNFKRLGISIRDANGDVKTGEQLFLESADGLKKMTSELERNSVAQGLYGRNVGSHMLPFLMQGSAEIKRQAEEAKKLGGVMSKELIAKSRDYITTQKQLMFAWAGVKNTVADELLPVFTKAMRSTIDWFLANQKVLVQLRLFIREVVKVVYSFAEWIAMMAAWSAEGLRMIAVMIAGEKYAFALAVGLGVLAAAFMSPVVAIGLFIAALALLVQDYQVWKMNIGEDTLFGDILEWLDAFANVEVDYQNHPVLSFFRDLAKAIEDVSKNWDDFLTMLADETAWETLVGTPFMEFINLTKWVQSLGEGVGRSIATSVMNMKLSPHGMTPFVPGGAVFSSGKAIGGLMIQNHVSVDIGASIAGGAAFGASDLSKTIAGEVERALDRANQKAFESFESEPPPGSNVPR